MRRLQEFEAKLKRGSVTIAPNFQVATVNWARLVAVILDRDILGRKQVGNANLIDDLGGRIG